MVIKLKRRNLRVPRKLLKKPQEALQVVLWIRTLRPLALRKKRHPCMSNHGGDIFLLLLFRWFHTDMIKGEEEVVFGGQLRRKHDFHLVAEKNRNIQVQPTIKYFI